MRILLDENLDVKLRYRLLPEHEARTVREMEWLGKQNGELLQLLLTEGFGAILTGDKRMPYQQNWTQYPMYVFVLNTRFNFYKAHRPLIPFLKELLDADLPVGVYLLTPANTPDVLPTCTHWAPPTS